VTKEAFADSQTGQLGDPAAHPTQAAMPKLDSSSIVTSMSAAKTPSPEPGSAASAGNAPSGWKPAKPGATCLAGSARAARQNPWPGAFEA
jgi:hypothetical protein